MELNRSQSNITKAASLADISTSSPFWAGNLAHLYLELSLKMDLEGAESRENAKTAHQYIRKAADACHLAAKHFGGEVLEIHGRTLHIGIEYAGALEVEAKIKGAAGLIHALLKKAYGSGGPVGWKIAADHGPTITVTTEGIHNDTSLVSLSPAANNPAKMLGRKAVPHMHLGSNIHGNWSTEPLDLLEEEYGNRIVAESSRYSSVSLSERVMLKQAKAVSFSSLSAINEVSAMAAPVGSPSAEDPYSCFGFVVSMDLDGFTSRVAAAATGSLEQQAQLAREFLEIMRKSVAFAAKHPSGFVQFPFAGDNAIFALVAENREDFIALKRLLPIEVATQWEEEMGDDARRAGFGGWGQAASGGGVPHGNSRGNLHVAGIVLEGRRFLVGVGPGMRYARQAFVHVEPSPVELAISKVDVSGLLPRLQNRFQECRTQQGETSSYYKKGKLADLEREVRVNRVEQEQWVRAGAATNIVMSSGTVSHRPHGRGNE